MREHLIGKWGVIAHDIIEGSVMSVQFLEFLCELVVCGYILVIWIESDGILVATHQPIPWTMQCACA